MQLIKFWPSRAAGKGVCGGVKNFGSALLQLARSVCVSSEHFFIIHVHRVSGAPPAWSLLRMAAQIVS